MGLLSWYISKLWQERLNYTLAIDSWEGSEKVGNLKNNDTNNVFSWCTNHPILIMRICCTINFYDRYWTERLNFNFYYFICLQVDSNGTSFKLKAADGMDITVQVNEPVS